MTAAIDITTPIPGIAGVLLDDDIMNEAEELDGYFSDTPLEPEVHYPPLNESYYETLLVMNLPKVPGAKIEKLTTVLRKILTKIGNIQQFYNPENTEEVTFPGYYMPYDEANDLTYGFCFVCYDNADAAKNAVEVLEGYKFDKNHSLSVMLYERAKQLSTVNTVEFTLPEEVIVAKKEAEKKEEGEGGITDEEEDAIKDHLASWLFDPAQRDQFIIRYGKETAVHWVDVSGGGGGASNAGTAAGGAAGAAAGATAGGNTGNYCNVELDYDGQREKDKGVIWCDYYCYWSTSGNYLATLIPQKGVVLWGGNNYEKLGRFVAPNVKHISFSPNENYMLTNNQDKRDVNAIKVYDVNTQKLLRSFPLYPDGVQQTMDDNNNTIIPPPPFLWSYDDLYIGRMGKDLISIYELPHMKLLDQRSLAAEGICEFQWNPKSNMIAYWGPEQKNHPAHVDIIEIPSRNKLRQKNLFNVSRCLMIWHELGHYLAVKVTRHTKSKKTLYNNIEFFRFYDYLHNNTVTAAMTGTGTTITTATADIPVEMLDMKDAVMAIQFEPKYGTKLAIIHAENPSASKVKVSIYDMMKSTDDNNKQKVSELNLIETLDNKQCNYISWSPAGNVIIMASLGDNASGTIEFYDVTQKTLVMKEHYRCNQIIWDPSGRTVASIVSQPIEGGNFKFAMDNGYILWSYQGKLLYQQAYETFYQFLWRPRYEHLLNHIEILKIKKNLKKYEKQFHKADQIRQRAIYLEQTAEKRYERMKYRTLVLRNAAKRIKTRAEYINTLYNGYDSDDESNYKIVERTIETILSRKEEVVM